MTRLHQHGFTYAMALAAIVIVGILAEVAHLATWRVLKADKEAELLARGQAYRRGIESFYLANGRYPRALEDLLKDPRNPARRHIRALYPDPMATGEQKDWLLIKAADGGISGVASASKEEPLKKANFPKEFEKFTEATTYSDWVFEYVPPAARGAQPPPPPTVPAAAPTIKTF